jgi:hypothetical protein
VPIRLRVISNNLAKFRELIAPLPVPTEYLEWEPLKCAEWVQQSDVVIIPNRLNEFSRCKSPNRAVFALEKRVPVIATWTPGMTELDGCAIFDDWEHGLEAYLTDRALRDRHLSRGADVIRERFAPEVVARRWLEAIEAAKRSAAHAAPARAAVAAGPVVVFLGQIIQDLELIVPLYERALARPGWRPVIWLTSHDLFRRPELQRRLESHGLRYELVEPGLPKGTGYPAWSDVAALVSASESSLRPHARAHVVTREAKRRRIPTFTLQHGFENVGLTYTDGEFPIETVMFASDVIFVWGPLESLHAGVPEETRRRCVPVGYPKVVDGRPRPLPKPCGHPLVSVFENLHWSRFSPAFRNGFLDDLDAIARSWPDVRFLIKPHPAGQWLTERYTGPLRLPSNVTIADSRAPEWTDISALDILQQSAAAITTPSTIALDAARLERPVAVAAYDLDLPAYSPLVLLRSRDDWIAFLASALGPHSADVRERSRRFAGGAAVDGDAIDRVLSVVAETIGIPRQPAAGHDRGRQPA